MPELIAADAGKRELNASKAVSARLFETSQTKRKTLLVRPVEGGGSEEIESIRFVFEDRESRCGGFAFFDTPAGQWRKRPQPSRSIYFQELPGEGISAYLPREMEGF